MDWRKNPAFTEAFQHSTASSRIEAKIGAAMLELAEEEDHEPKWRADMANGRKINPSILTACKTRMLDLLAISPETFGALRVKGGHGDRYLLAAIDELTEDGVIERTPLVRGGNKCLGYRLTKSPEARGCAAALTAIQKGDPSAVGAANAAKAAEAKTATLPSPARRVSGGASGIPQ